ncbi:glycosyltransferase family 2 protein [Yeosuana sp. MJ-SS3]|uniref:Glycosyltransferase family 2 protein n=1 Tax=Gilvirhabdus luticola TaxID=3079858 RepID=A0ABU3U4Y3_9FLAO|nr:glycosyltransferase family 2 protein [Yeosuana sp. MJ-SS3]MDU8885470.1 glycosyltransferase family 2 protein [Yeosuana sp. MJ-SS3]
MTYKRVSIILPNYNHAPYLKERLDSIFNQTYQDFEVIILDDASTDNSLEVLNQYKNHVKVSHFIVNSKNTGSPFKQWKKGLELAKGKYTWIAESDDSCKLNFLESQLDALQNFEVAVSKVCIQKNNIITKTEIQHSAFLEKDNIKLEASNFSFNCPITNVSSIIFERIEENKLKKSTFQNYGIIGDIVFYYEFFKNRNIIFNRDTVNYYRQDIGSLSLLDNRSVTYYKRYYSEHLKLINLLYYNEKDITTAIRKKYITRQFNKVRNRVIKKKKLTLTYLSIFLKYKYHLLIS